MIAATEQRSGHNRPSRARQRLPLRTVNHKTKSLQGGSRRNGLPPSMGQGESCHDRRFGLVARRRQDALLLCANFLRGPHRASTAAKQHGQSGDVMPPLRGRDRFISVLPRVERRCGHRSRYQHHAARTAPSMKLDLPQLTSRAFGNNARPRQSQRRGATEAAPPTLAGELRTVKRADPVDGPRAAASPSAIAGGREVE